LRAFQESRIHVPAQFQHCLMAWGLWRNTKTLTKHIGWVATFKQSFWHQVWEYSGEFHKHHESLQHSFVYFRSYSLVVITKIHPCQYSYTEGACYRVIWLIWVLLYSPPLRSTLQSHTSLELSPYLIATVVHFETAHIL
jgi:hypothetical protein